MREILSFLCYFGLFRDLRHNRYPRPGAQTNACATLVEIGFSIDMSMVEQNFLVIVSNPTPLRHSS